MRKHVFQGEVWREGTAGNFKYLVADNVPVFQEYLGVQIFPGSLNIGILGAPDIHDRLDAGCYKPAFVIPWAELSGKWNPPRLGDGQAWRCALSGVKFQSPHSCWVFRRMKSQVPQTVIEILAVVSLSETYSLEDRDPVTVTLLEGPAQSSD